MLPLVLGHQSARSPPGRILFTKQENVVNSVIVENEDYVVNFKAILTLLNYAIARQVVSQQSKQI